MENLNKIHGSSVLTVIPTTDAHRDAIPEADAELIYVAREVFQDGAIATRVCWRKPSPPGKPNVVNVVHPTNLTTIELAWKI